MHCECTILICWIFAFHLKAWKHSILCQWLDPFHRYSRDFWSFCFGERWQFELFFLFDYFSYSFLKRPPFIISVVILALKCTWVLHVTGIEYMLFHSLRHSDSIKKRKHTKQNKKQLREQRWMCPNVYCDGIQTILHMGHGNIFNISILRLAFKESVFDSIQQNENSLSHTSSGYGSSVNFDGWKCLTIALQWRWQYFSFHFDSFLSLLPIFISLKM